MLISTPPCLGWHSSKHRPRSLYLQHTIASAVGGIPEEVVEGKTGYLVPVGDARAMAGRVLGLLEDGGLREEVGKQAVKDAARRFSLDHMAAEYLRFYQTVLQRQ